MDIEEGERLKEPQKLKNNNNIENGKKKKAVAILSEEAVPENFSKTGAPNAHARGVVMEIRLCPPFIMYPEKV